MGRGKLIYQGKAKFLDEGQEPGKVGQYGKDDATAFNAETKDLIQGNGVLNQSPINFL